MFSPVMEMQVQIAIINDVGKQCCVDKRAAYFACLTRRRRLVGVVVSSVHRRLPGIVIKAGIKYCCYRAC